MPKAPEQHGERGKFTSSLIVKNLYNLRSVGV
jgi:hypothetical protein